MDKQTERIITDPRTLKPGRDKRTRERVEAARKLRAGGRYPYAGRKARLRGKLVTVVGFRPDGGLHVQPPAGDRFPCSPFSVEAKPGSKSKAA